MAYQKYTQCTSIGGYVPFHATSFVSLGALVTMLAAFMIVATSLWLIPILISVAVAVIAFCVWYLYHRLICLNPNQQCAIGVVTNILHPSVGSIVGKLGDNDATMNILLAPAPLDYSQDLSQYTSHVQGDLIAPQVSITNAGLGYATSGGDLNHLRALHCEFEGSGIRDLLGFAIVVLALLIALLAITLLAPELAPLLFILWLFAALIGAMGIVNLFTSSGTPSTSDPAGNPGNLVVGNIVAVTGDWIYDGGHVGWNEIHAVHNCQIITDTTIDLSDSNKAWPTEISGMPFVTDADVNQVLTFWCAAIAKGNGAVKGGSMTDPGNNWVIHPVVDGCKKPVVIV
jgi:hypothetical protein